MRRQASAGSAAVPRCHCCRGSGDSGEQQPGLATVPGGPEPRSPLRLPKNGNPIWNFDGCKTMPPGWLLRGAGVDRRGIEMCLWLQTAESVGNSGNRQHVVIFGDINQTPVRFWCCLKRSF